MAFAGGDGSQSNPYQIETAQQLQDISNDTTAYYILISDVDLSSFNWSPIGGFTGSLNGDGFVVSNLTVGNNSSTRQGLFGSIDDGGIVKNIGVINADVTGSSDVGILAGTIFSGGSVEKCFSQGIVFGDSSNTGGLVGTNSGDITICYSLANVDGNSSNAGGLVGKTFSSVSKSYSTGTVSGSSDVGGFIGESFGTVTDCFWDTESSGLSTGIVNDGGTTTNLVGLTTSEMQGQEAETNMSGFDFTNDWDVVTSEQLLTSDGYPILTALNEQNQLETQGINSFPKGLFVWTGSTWKKVAGV